MRIIVMDTGRGSRAGTVQLWRERLALEPDDTVTLLTWQPPAEPLPVAAHLVFGPRFDAFAPPRRVPTATPGHRDVPAEADPADEPGGRADAEAPLGSADLAEQLPEPMQGRADVDAVDSDRPAPSAPGADRGPGGTDARGGLDRLGRAARRRLGRARRLARGAVRRGKSYVRRGQGAPARWGRRIIGVRSDGVATSFALSVLRSADAAAEFRRADVVVPVDARSQRAAWVLGRRVPGPDIVVTYPAAQRVIAARRAGGADAAD